jgi:branched-subunit amino acid transport protein
VPVTRGTIESLSKLWVIWIWGYLILGGIATTNGKTSFLAAAVDAPLPSWFKMVFLNVPLQIAVALTASVLLARTRTTEEKPGPFTVAASIAATLLILVNLLTAILLLF